MRTRTRIGVLMGMLIMLLLSASRAWAEANEIRILTGTGGIGFLQLTVMEKLKLVEKYAAEAGLKDVKASYINLGGPTVSNDALLSGAADIVPAGPPGMITIWDRTRKTSNPVVGVAAMASVPMYLNSRNPNVKSIEDITASDKVAVIAVKVSTYALVLQMAARTKFGPQETFKLDAFTVGLPHSNAVAAMLSGKNEIDLHFTGPPFSEMELQDPKVRTILNSDDVMGGSTSFTVLYTTKKFHDANPQLYGAFLKALKEATDYINADKRRAAETYLSTMSGTQQKIEGILPMFEDKRNTFTVAPQNVYKYADFMYSINSIKNKPESWKDLFFPEIHDLPGS
jgi:NitT/TauT family transport system substrate-binding protein